MATSNYPVIQAGQRVTAALLTSMLPQTVIKPSDETVTSSTTLQNDNDLVSPVAANAGYIFDCLLDYEGDSVGTGDLKAQWACPSGATARFMVVGIDAAGNPYCRAIWGQSTPFAVGSRGAGVLTGVSMRGTILTSSTAGNLQLQWAQNTSNATSTIVHAQSYLSVTRVS